jgi:hypothetical protein
MRSVPTYLGAVGLLGLTVLVPGRSTAETRAPDPIALRKAHDDLASLQEELARVNAEIATLKRADRSVRNDYRLRDRMADAEALAQRLTRAESRLRSLEQPSTPLPNEAPRLDPPQASPQDGSLELEAKADLIADQASKLDKQADALTRAAAELRARKALRRRASAWDRDPFAGLESSRRNLAVSQSTQKATVGGGTNGDSSTRGTLGAPGGTPPPVASPTAGAASPTTPTYVNPPSTETMDGAGKTATAGATESTASKSSPIALGTAQDRQLEQRLYLDPTIAAELRQALGSSGTSSDPDALDRAAKALRARARTLGQEAEKLRRRSHTP